MADTTLGGSVRLAVAITETKLSILACDGIAAIWQLEVAAAEAHRTEHPRSADAILEIAEAAEAAWLARSPHLRGHLARVIASFG
jgi:hypothetical protein